MADFIADLHAARERLPGHTLCLCKDGKYLFSEKRGIAPMMEFIARGESLSGYSAADTVVGKAAALLFVKCGVKAVFAKTLSVLGQKVLNDHGIVTEYETLAERIINRAGTDICPMEKTVQNCDDPEEAYRLLKEKTALMAERTERGF